MPRSTEPSRATNDPKVERGDGRRRRGSVKFVLLHHGGCTGGGFHYRIDANGVVHAGLEESDRGQHPRSIGVVIDGNFESEVPGEVQMASLRKLILSLKLRYPAVEIGAHRQVRGGSKTTCPGRGFPMKALAEWSRTELLRQRDAIQARDIEAQYSRI